MVSEIVNKLNEIEGEDDDDDDDDELKDINLDDLLK
jgi:hypothetical protein